MNVTKTPLEGLLIIEPKVFGDDRGYFFESYQKERYTEVGVSPELVQDNQSKSARGILRGLHLQLGDTAQGKLVWVIAGRVLDVAVDCRVGSPTFGQHVATELSADNKKQMWVPRGFAHGFQSLEEGTIFVYKCDNYYAPENEITLLYNDPALGIEWPIKEAILSEKDKKGLTLKDLRGKLAKS